MKEVAFPAGPHDHRACMAETLEAAERLAAARDEKLTPLRRRVLEILLESHRPLGAYDILGGLARDGAKPAPPTVYRALDFLTAQGFVHRIDSLNAFAACFAPDRAHRSHFFLCRGCGRAAEIHDAALDEALTRAAADAAFGAERETVEISGLCADCRRSASVTTPQA
ncbi:MAG TPA: Fur family transcriptional regulator [Rhizomicrobium sp.]|nr:Fur family transcriptional regulator [Rhizomicrobium sp.]